MKMRSEALAVLGLISLLAAPTRGEEPPARAANQLADQLKRHPAQLSKSPLRRGLYMMDLAKGDVTMIADEPDPGADSCGSPRWSHDGRRILFDVMPEGSFHLLHIKAIERGDDSPKMTDLGPGARPTFSPDDKRIAFLLHDNAVPNEESGIWVMQADGSQRRRAGEFGMPLWSPDGRQFLIVGFGDPRNLKLIDIEKSESRRVEIADYSVFGWPSWADAQTVAAIVGSEGTGDTVALVDVSEPEKAKVKEVLWKPGPDDDMKPLWPVYSPSTRRCVFVGVKPQGMALYSVEKGQSGQAKRIEPDGLDRQIGGLAFSPDGRYLLFCSNRDKR
jgi:Tol biopolymer transport system component